MHHPWRWIREHLPDWEVSFAPLEAGTWGQTDCARRRITIDSRLTQAERRSTVEHERQHAVAGDVGPQCPKREVAVDQAAARALIPLDKLVDACLWAHDLEELADDLWVDLATVQCRIEHLHPSERAAIKRALAQRDWHEEGREVE